MEQAIRDPVIPFVGAVGNRFTPGKIIRIRGSTPGIAYRFDVNLQCGPTTTPRDNTALQISVRILDGYIAMNCLQSGIWGKELRGQSQPITRASPFEMIIMCDVNNYKIIINGQLFHHFPQTIHYSCITHLTIEGDVLINEILYGSQENPIRPGLVANRQADGDFEFINADSKPPSYFEAVQNFPANDQQYLVNREPPYPIAPMAMPIPVSGSYSSPSAPTMTLPPPPPETMPVPLNAASSNFRPVQKSNKKKIFGYFLAVLIGGIIIISVIIMKTKRRSVEIVDHSNTYSSSYNSRNSHNTNYNWD